MRKIVMIFLFVQIAFYSFAQSNNGKKNGLIGSVNKALNKITGPSLSKEQVISGLKEALATGAERSVATLSVPDGFFANAALKIILPEEARKVERTFRSMGLSRQVDQAVLSMNRAAEDAARSATPIFADAIRGMSIQDAFGILKGADTAATAFLRSKTTLQLIQAFRPVIEQSLAKVDATKHWNALFSAYNRVSVNKINPDLSAYVTERALQGIFTQLGKEEAKIRKDPAARTTEILQKVFAQ